MLIRAPHRRTAAGSKFATDCRSHSPPRGAVAVRVREVKDSPRLWMGIAGAESGGAVPGVGGNLRGRQEVTSTRRT